MTSEKYPLDWVDNFIDQIRPHLFFRETDGLLILLPNQSYRLNNSGQKILKKLLDGAKFSEVFPQDNLPENIRRDLYNFFTGIASMVKGCLGEGHGRAEVEHIEYNPPFHKLPVLSEIAVTYKCNLTCKFCYASCKKTNIDEMNTDQIAIILHKIRHEAQVPSVSITGGEPTLRKDISRIVEIAVKEGLRVNLISNGTLISESLAYELKSKGLFSAQISLEGPNSTIHDNLTGVSGSFDATLIGIKKLQKAGITVHTNTTISGGNIRFVHFIPELVKSLGLDRFSMNMIIPSAEIKSNTPELLVSYSEIGQIVLNLRETARKNGLKFMWYSPTPYCIFNPIAFNLGNKGCAACDGLLSVDPQGRILPCSSFFEPQGSLLDNSFTEIWHGTCSTSIRNKNRAPLSCRTCEHFKICEGACPLYWEIMGCKELEKHGAMNA